MHPSPTSRGRRHALALVALALGAMALAACLSLTSAQSQELSLVATARKTNRSAALSSDAKAMAKAQAWSAHMARTGVLEHTGGGTRVDPTGVTGWCGYGENVGYGSSVASVHQAFLASPPHRANMLGRWNRIGVGVATKGRTVWVTEIYLRNC